MSNSSWTHKTLGRDSANNFCSVGVIWIYSKAKKLGAVPVGVQSFRTMIFQIATDSWKRHQSKGILLYHDNPKKKNYYAMSGDLVP